jgi:site-specific DNA-cytosine methylase
MGIEFTIVACCDVKESAAKFVLKNHKSRVQHYFKDAESLIAKSGFCEVHQKNCSLQDERIDIVIAGTPCQPFSAMRDRGGSTSRTGRPDRHPGWDTTFVTLKQIVQEWEPSLMLLEQVCAFSSCRSDEPASPLEMFGRLMLKFFKAVRSVELHNSVWTTVKRDRPGP